VSLTVDAYFCELCVVRATALMKLLVRPVILLPLSCSW
jgi:hypothetical protein